MSVIRQANLLGQQRLDIPHIRGIESSIAADFDLLAGQIMAGKNPLVVQGFNLIVLPAGTPASQLQLQVAGSVIMHPEASENGTIFQVPAARAPETLNASNNRVQGGFTANAVNYIGIDLRRTADATTADLVQFLDADTSLENPKTVPLGRTLDYVIVISTQDFSTTPGVAPLAKVTTDSFNNIATNGIEDARNLKFRLGAGGTITNWKHQFPWPGGRGEPGSNGAQPNSDFTSGDKSITSLKDWIDAVMTRIWELGGGEYWYSATADRNVKLVRAGSTFTNGDWFSWDGTNLLWKGLTVIFDNSTGTYNAIADQTSTLSGLTNLADGECIYVDLDRTQNRVAGVNPLQPVKAQLSTLGVPVTPGARLVLAWRRGSGSQCIVTRDAQFPVNATFTVATTVSTGVVQLHQNSLTPLSPVVLTDGDLNTATGVVALNANLQAGWTSTSGIGLLVTGAGTFAGIQGVGGGTNGPGVQGVGTGTGNGVEGYSGPTGGAGLYGKGGSTSGNALLLVKNATTNNAPLARAQNAAGSTRWSLDGMGFPLGGYSLYRQSWLPKVNATSTITDISTPFPEWTASFANGGQASTLDAGNYPSPILHLAITTSNASSSVLYTPAQWYGIGFPGLEVALEFEVRRLNSGQTNQTIYLGLHNNASLPNVTSWFMRFRSTATGNWIAEVGNSGVATVDTGVAPSATMQRLRIEYHASGAGGYSQATCLFFIDGVLKATITNSDISFAGFTGLGLAFGLMASAVTSVSQAIEIGIVRSAWNINADCASTTT